MSPTDPIDRILLSEAAASVPPPVRVTVLDDPHGDLTREVSLLWPAAEARTYHDSQTAEHVCRAALGPAGPPEMSALAEALDGSELVLARLPKALTALDELAETVARDAAPGARLIAAGREKHLNRSMNDALASHFTDVRASLGRQKARALIASGPRPSGPPSYPHRRLHSDLGLTVCAHGGVFAGTGLDAGTRLLLDQVDQLPEPRRAVDLGCGTGLLAAALARRFPAADVLAIDDSRAAVASTTATLEANGLTGRAEQFGVSTGSALPTSGPVDLVLCNPPFHRGTAKDSSLAFAMFAAAATALKPGTGELWTVYNAHLPYLPALRRLVGPTTIAARDRSYLVTRSAARA